MSKELSKPELKLISKFLEMAADEFSNRNCNDIENHVEFALTPKEWDKLNTEFQIHNGDNNQLQRGRPDPFNDACWVSYLAKRVKSLL